MPDSTKRLRSEYERLPDVLTELYRIDLQYWGDFRTAAVVRCVAAANWCDGRPAKLTGIATTLSMAASTVHERLSQLGVPTEGPNGTAVPTVRRVIGGYVLTETGNAKAERWCAAQAQVSAALRDVGGCAGPRRLLMRT